MRQPSIGVVVITHEARRHLRRCLPVFLASTLKPRVLVVNSSSADGTVELARELGAEVLVIPRNEFNHGATRELARRRLGTDIVVMVTPDAYASDPLFLDKLVSPLVAGTADVSYARQLPHDGADIFESFPRQFNYPETSHVRSLADVGSWGIYTFFCSNSCAAWRNRMLDEVGGFEATLTNEDYFTVAKILRAGGRIAYVAEAEIQHSHRYTIVQEFTRYFDTGYVRAENPRITDLAGRAERRGASFAKGLIRTLLRRSPLLIPYAVLQLAAKWLGFRIGFLSYRAPRGWCRACSAQSYFWDSLHCRHPRP